MNTKLVLVTAALVLAIATPAHAQQPPKLATVEIFHGDTAWTPGRPLAVCVQTGLREAGVVGEHRIEYRFALRSSDGSTRSMLPELQFYWADTSFMLVNGYGNLVSTTTGKVRGQGREMVEDRAVKGDGLLPGDNEFNHVCGQLTGTTITFVPRDPVPVAK